jgi:hypothetical protein
MIFLFLGKWESHTGPNHAIMVEGPSLIPVRIILLEVTYGKCYCLDENLAFGEGLLLSTNAQPLTFKS